MVVGDQSSGKSSVLEGLTDLPFPRDSTLCTRFATQIVFRRAEKESIFISIIPSASCDPDRANKLRSFKVNELKTLSVNTFASILSKVSHYGLDKRRTCPFILKTDQACEVMGIPSPSKPVMSSQSTFSDDVFRVELRGPNYSHLSVINVPGIFRTPTEGLTTKEDMALVNGLVQRFIGNERTIILAVLPANVDIATQEILGLAGEVDPHGQRTLGVLTKPDLVDRGAEKDVINLVQGKRNKLRLGYCVVRNRGQQERMTSSSERHGTESIFFNTGPFSSLPKDRLGIPALHKRLRDLLSDITQREFPNVKRDISQRISACETELHSLGPSRESDDQQRRFLLDLAVKFQEISSHALEARYGMGKYFNDR